METSELKNMLIARIRQIDDKAFLQAIKTITDVKAEKVSRSGSFNQGSGWHSPATQSGKPQKNWLNTTNEDYFDEMEQFLRDI